MITEADYNQLVARVGALEDKRYFTFHRHSGIDSQKVMYSDIDQRKILVSHTLYGATAATAANYGPFYIVNSACYISDVWEAHTTAGSDAGTVTLTIEKLSTGTAPDAGTVLLNTAMNLKSTANTPQQGSIVSSIVSRNLATTDRLCLKDSGTLTSVAGVTVLVELTLV